MALVLYVYLLGIFVFVHGEDRQRTNAFQRITNNLTDLESQISDLNAKYEELTRRLEPLEDGLACPLIEDSDIVIPENTMQDNSQHQWSKGDVVSFPCDTDFYQCGSKLTATCQEGNLWSTSGDSNCVNKNYKILKPVYEAETYFPCDLREGTKITIKGQPTSYETFVFVFRDDNENNVLNIGCRNTWEKVVIYNTYIDGSWGTEIRKKQMTFPLYRVFIFEVTRTSEGYKISINNGGEDHFTRYVKDPTYFSLVGGGVVVDEVNVEYP